MAVMNGASTEKSNGDILSSPPPLVVEEENSKTRSSSFHELEENASLFDVFNHLIESINHHPTSTTPMADRIKKSLLEAAPMFREAIMNTRRQVLLWTRRGSPLRALLVVSVGIVSLIALTGMMVFMLLLVAATVNAIIISLLVSLAAVGGFLAIFFSCLTAMYIGVLCMAAFATFTVTVSAIIVALIAAGWIGLIWIVWVAVSKSASLAKRSLTTTVAADGGHQK